MELFWHRGFASSSMDDLVRATGTTRHSIYLEFEGKEQLFEQCLAVYGTVIVAPALARVETGAEGFGDIAAYFEHQIRLAERAGLPGPGCLIANAMTEIAPSSMRVSELVGAHQERLRAAFEQALWRTAEATTGTTHERRKIHDHSLALAAFANGLWSISRITKDPEQLRRSVRAMLQAVEHDM